MWNGGGGTEFDEFSGTSCSVQPPMGVLDTSYRLAAGWSTPDVRQRGGQAMARQRMGRLWPPDRRWWQVSVLVRYNAMGLDSRSATVGKVVGRSDCWATVCVAVAGRREDRGRRDACLLQRFFVPGINDDGSLGLVVWPGGTVLPVVETTPTPNAIACQPDGKIVIAVGWDRRKFGAVATTSMGMSGFLVRRRRNSRTNDVAPKERCGWRLPWPCRTTARSCEVGSIGQRDKFTLRQGYNAGMAAWTPSRHRRSESPGPGLGTKLGPGGSSGRPTAGLSSPGV